MVVDIHLRIVPASTYSSIVKSDSLLIDGQRLHPNERPEAIELLILDKNINALSTRIDDPHGGVPRLIDNVLEFGGQSSHVRRIPEISAAYSRILMRASRSSGGFPRHTQYNFCTIKEVLERILASIRSKVHRALCANRVYFATVIPQVQDARPDRRMNAVGDARFLGYAK